MARMLCEPTNGLYQEEMDVLRPPFNMVGSVPILTTLTEISFLHHLSLILSDLSSVAHAWAVLQFSWYPVSADAG